MNMIAGYEIAIGFAMGFLGSIPLAGPVALLVMTKGLAREFYRASFIACGASVAEGIMAAGAFAGLGIIYERIPEFEYFFQWLGVAILVAVGVWFWIRGVSKEEPVNQKPERQEGGISAFLIGFGLVIGNLGMIATWGGAIAAIETVGILSPGGGHAMAFGLGVCAGVFSWLFLLLKLISKYGDIIAASALNFIVKCIGCGLCIAGLVAGVALLASQ